MSNIKAIDGGIILDVTKNDVHSIHKVTLFHGKETAYSIDESACTTLYMTDGVMRITDSDDEVHILRNGSCLSLKNKSCEIEQIYGAEFLVVQTT
jgi:hypothetical protein